MVLVSILIIRVKIKKFHRNLSECTGAVPTAPTGATMDHDGSITAGSIITYTCSGGNKVYAMVSITCHC